MNAGTRPVLARDVYFIAAVGFCVFGAPGAGLLTMIAWAIELWATTRPNDPEQS